jgi:hypothetical protein
MLLLFWFYIIIFKKTNVILKLKISYEKQIAIIILYFSADLNLFAIVIYKFIIVIYKLQIVIYKFQIVEFHFFFNIYIKHKKQINYFFFFFLN